MADMVNKLLTPLNDYSIRKGTESFMPGPLGLECQKAARILRTLCQDVVEPDPNHPPNDLQRAENLITIPPSVIAHALALAIFTTGRAAFHLTASTGSGLLVARLPDGRWSPPSAIRLHSVGVGFAYGADVCDTVCVINSPEALAIFTSTRFTLGPDLTLAVGRCGGGRAVAFNGVFPSGRAPHPHAQDGNLVKPCRHHTHHRRYLRKRKPTMAAGRLEPASTPDETLVQPPLEDEPQPEQTGQERPEETQEHHHDLGARIDEAVQPIVQSLQQPVYSYSRSRGAYLGVQLNGTVISERAAANEAFYGAPVTVHDILEGKTPVDAEHPLDGGWKLEAEPLFEALRWAERREA